MGWGNCLEGRGVGAVGRMVASRTRDLQFKSHHLKKINIWLSLAKLKTKGGAVDIILASHPAAPSSILGVSEFVQIGCCQYFFDSSLIREWTVQILIVIETI